MPSLQSISAIPNGAVDLLEAVGYMTARDLCESYPQGLIDELIKANTTLGILSTPPTLDDLLRWKESALHEIGDGYVESVAPTHGGEIVPADSNGTVVENVAEVASELHQENDPPAITQSGGGDSVNFEHDPEVKAMLEVSPEAELVSTDLIKRSSLAVRDISEGLLLTDCQGDVEINVMTPQGMKAHQRQAAKIRRAGLMTSRIRSFEEAETEEHHIKPLDKGKPRDVVSLSDGMNAGLTPQSRRFVRGVLHPDPWSIRISAFFAIWVQMMLVIAIVAIPSLIAYDVLYEVPEAIWWVGGIAATLVISALAYLFWGLSARCRVCGQRQFAPKKCLKNTKAHHIRLIGYIFPTALHAIFYKWFYCTYCGTAVRLKK